VPGRTAFYQRHVAVVIALAALMQGEIAIWYSKQLWLGASTAHIAVMIGTFAALVPSSLFAASSVTLAWDASTSTNIAVTGLLRPGQPHYTNTLTLAKLPVQRSRT